MLSSPNADWPRNVHRETVSRAPSDTHMQSAITSVLCRNGVAGRAFSARPEAGTAPLKLGVLSQNIGETRLPDCFSQQKLNALIQPQQTFSFLFRGPAGGAPGLQP